MREDARGCALPLRASSSRFDHLVKTGRILVKYEDVPCLCALPASTRLAARSVAHSPRADLASAPRGSRRTSDRRVRAYDLKSILKAICETSFRTSESRDILGLAAQPAAQGPRGSRISSSLSC
jgi:hypothetical protein